MRPNRAAAALFVLVLAVGLLAVGTGPVSAAEASPADRIHDPDESGLTSNGGGGDDCPSDPSEAERAGCATPGKGRTAPAASPNAVDAAVREDRRSNKRRYRSQRHSGRPDPHAQRQQTKRYRRQAGRSPGAKSYRAAHGHARGAVGGGGMVECQCVDIELAGEG